MRNTQFYVDFFSENGHLDEILSNLPSSQLILIYVKNIKNVNKEEIEPQLLQTVLNRLNSLITTMVGKDYHLKKEEIIFDSGIKQEIADYTNNTDIIVTVNLSDKLMDDTGLNRKNPWEWKYTIIAKEMDKEPLIIPFKNITKGTKAEIEAIVFSKVRTIVRNDIDTELRKHITESNLVLSISDDRIKDYSQSQIISTIIKVKSREHKELMDDIYHYDVIVQGQPHDISNNNGIKMVMENKNYSFSFDNITKVRKVEVEKQLIEIFKGTIKKVLDFDITTADFLLTTNISEISDFTEKQNIIITIATMGTKISGNLQLAVTITGEAHDINIDSIKSLLTTQKINFNNITQGTKQEIENHLQLLFPEIIKQELDLELTTDEFTISTDAGASNDYSHAQNINVIINTNSSKVSGNIQLPITITGEAHDINKIKDKLVFTNPRILESKKIYYKWELKELILPEINKNFQKIIDEVYHFQIEEYHDYSLDINSIATENYNRDPAKVQLIINGLGNKIRGNLIIDIDITRKSLVNINSLSSIIAKDVVTIYLVNENTDIEIKNRLLITTIKNFIALVKKEHNIDVIYGKDFEVDFQLPVMESCHDNNTEIKIDSIITISSKGNKVIGELNYKQTIIYHLSLLDFNLLLSPIVITLPKKINDQYVFNVNKCQLENIIIPVVKAKVETELYKILRIKPIFDYHYSFENNIQPLHKYFMVNKFIFKIKVKDCEQIIEQMVIVKPEPINLNEIILPPIYHQKLYLNNYFNTSKAEIETYLFAMLRVKFAKLLQIRYQKEKIPLTKIYSYENKYYCLKSNINEIDNYQQVKNVIVSIESLQSEFMVGKIEIPISVQGVTKSLAELQYLFDIKTKILNVKPTELNTVIDNEFKRWMLENYEIPLVSDDFTLTSEILTAVDDRTKIVNITIKANDKIQTKISDQFTTSFEILTPSYDISNLKVNILKEVDYPSQYSQKVTKLQLSQLILPLIKNEIINIVKNQANIEIEQYQDFWLDINVPEINDCQNQKPITVVINTTNNKITGHLLLSINIKKKDKTKMIIFNNK